MDPTQMSVRALRSTLSEYGVEVPSGAVKKADLVMLYLEEGVAKKVLDRAKSDDKLMKRKRKSSSIPWAEVDVIPKKSQRKSLDQSEVRRKTSNDRQSMTSKRKRDSAVRKRSVGKRVTSVTSDDDSSEAEIVTKRTARDDYRSEEDDIELIDISMSPSPPPVKRSKRPSKTSQTPAKKEKTEETQLTEILEKRQKAEMERLEKKLALERKKIERRQSRELAEITARREALEKERIRLQAALSERDVSTHQIKGASKMKRRVTGTPVNERRKRESMLPRLTPENTKRGQSPSSKAYRIPTRISPPRGYSPTHTVGEEMVKTTALDSEHQWPAAPLSPAVVTAAYDVAYDSDTDDLPAEDVYREEDEEGLSLEVLVTTVVLVISVCIGLYLFINFRTTPLPFCSENHQIDCIACPRHAVCDGFDMNCLSGYVKRWRDGWECVEDIETKRIAQSILTNEFERLLRQRKGERDCDQLARPVMLEHEAKLELERMYRTRVGARKAANSFDDLYKEIERLVTLDPELTVSRETGSAGYYYTTSSPPLRPLGCSIRLALIEKSVYIGAALFVAVVVAFKVWQLRTISTVKTIVLEELKRARIEDDSGVPIVHLRDSVVPPIFLKGFIWKGVCSSIEADSRVGRTLQLLHGEHQDMWEWEAPV